MAIKKQFLKSKPVCKVSFKLNAKDAIGAKTVQIVGEFNNWDQSTTNGNCRRVLRSLRWRKPLNPLTFVGAIQPGNGNKTPNTKLFAALQISIRRFEE